MELKKDLLHVTYNPEQVTTEQMLKAIAKLDYQGAIVPHKGAPPAP